MAHIQYHTHLQNGIDIIVPLGLLRTFLSPPHSSAYAADLRARNQHDVTDRSGFDLDIPFRMAEVERHGSNFSRLAFWVDF